MRIDPTERLLKRRYALYFATLYALYLVFLLIALRQRNPAFTAGITTVLLPAIEITLLCMLGLVAWHLRHSRLLALPALLVFLAVPLLVMLVYLVQGFSAHLSGHYITVLALENYTDGGQYAAKPLFFVIAALGIGGWICLSLAAIKTRKRPGSRHLGRGFVVSLVTVSVLFGGMFDGSSFTEKTLQLRPDMVPVTSFVRKLRDLRKRNSLADMTETLSQHGITLPAGQHFPLLRNEAYSDPLSFGKTHLAIERPNVIVIFAEGLSASFLEAYGGRHPGLMANIDRFASRSMTVQNYFNHTSATYRGIQGQLTSVYPRNGGAELGGWESDSGDNAAQLRRINYQTIPDILLAKGYETAFLSSSPEGAKFNAMLQSLGFETVYSVETLSELLGRKTELHSGTTDAADGEIFSGLTGYLRKQAQSRNKKPFFVGTYNIGTHAFLDVDGSGITYGTGENPALNRMHNLDVQIGKFLDYFQNSQFADNTLLIITADHATYPEPAVIEALQTADYTPHFIDRIPLIVYYKGLSLPMNFDSKDRTSVDFAPTLLHLLSFQSAKNAFIGRSLFEYPPEHHAPLAAIGDDFYYISTQGASEANSESATDKHVAYQDYVRMYYWLESQNRVFPPRETASN